MNDPNDHKYRKYHPYQDLYNVPAQNLYNLPTSPEFLFHEESLNQRRSWSENLQYYTGTGYLTGAILGGSKGSIEGIRAAEPGESLKLRVNRVLNSGGQRKSNERFDDTRSEFHSKRLFTSCDMTAFDESPKIVEIDTYKPRSRSRRFNVASSECGEELPYQAISSPLPCPMPARISIPECKGYQDFEWYYTGEECRFSTSHSTPRFANSAQSIAPATPAKSICGDAYFRPYSNFPNYMANTQSFKAKLRSHSAPKQRPEPGSKKRLSLNEIMASRNSISSVRMQRPCTPVDEHLVIDGFVSEEVHPYQK